MESVSNLRKLIRDLLRESMGMPIVDNTMMDEERITNPESKEFVKKRENFIGSHIFGERISDSDEMYACYSYNESFPAYLWYKDRWYYNTDQFINPDNSVNEFTPIHMELMKPSNDLHGLAGHFMKEMIRKFMEKHGDKDLEHTGVNPGTKN